MMVLICVMCAVDTALSAAVLYALVKIYKRIGIKKIYNGGKNVHKTEQMLPPYITNKNKWIER